MNLCCEKWNMRGTKALLSFEITSVEKYWIWMNECTEMVLKIIHSNCNKLVIPVGINEISPHLRIGN